MSPRPRRRFAIKLLAALVGLLTGLLLAELATRILAPQDLSGSWRVPSKTRGYYLNKAGGRSRHVLGDRVVTYRFNRLHQRGPEIGRGRRRVLCLGDSMTFGWRLEEEHTFVARLERMADAEFGSGEYEFLNAGVGGWGTAQCLAYLEEFGDEIKPDAVVVFISGGDIGRSSGSGLYTLRDEESLELDAHSVSPNRLKAFVNALPAYQWLLEHSHLVQLIRNVMVSLSQPRAAAGPPATDPPAPKGASRAELESIRLGQALFRRMHAWCLARSVPLFALTTGYERVHGLDTPEGSTGSFVATAAEFFEKERIPYQNLFDAVTARIGRVHDGYVIPGDGHPNEEGARVIAECAWVPIREWLGPLKAESR